MLDADLAVTAAAVAVSAWALEVTDRPVPISLGPWLAGIVRLMRLDIRTALCLMNLPFAACLTPDEYRRAVHSMRFDDSILSLLADLTGDPTFLRWQNGDLSIRADSNTDVPRAVYRHAVVCEYAHAHLVKLAARPRGRPERTDCYRRASLSRGRIEPVDSWVAIDFETANGSRASACSVAVVRVSGDEEKESYATLIRPPDGHDRFDARNTAVHGIRRTDVVGAPRWPVVWSQLRDFIGDTPVVAHNAAFDTSVIRGANSAVGIAPPALRYACTLVIARQTWQLDSYTLPRVARAAGIVFGDHHRAEADARAAANVLLAEHRVHGTETLDGLLDSARVRWGRTHAQGFDGCRKC